jgi:hypothetical protein
VYILCTTASLFKKFLLRMILVFPFIMDKGMYSRNSKVMLIALEHVTFCPISDSKIPTEYIIFCCIVVFKVKWVKMAQIQSIFTYWLFKNP